jgi:hypothetical protein
VNLRKIFAIALVLVSAFNAYAGSVPRDLIDSLAQGLTSQEGARVGYVVHDPTVAIGIVMERLSGRLYGNPEKLKILTGELYARAPQKFEQDVLLPFLRENQSTGGLVYVSGVGDLSTSTLQLLEKMVAQDRYANDQLSLDISKFTFVFGTEKNKDKPSSIIKDNVVSAAAASSGVKYSFAVVAKPDLRKRLNVTVCAAPVTLPERSPSASPVATNPTRYYRENERRNANTLPP